MFQKLKFNFNYYCMEIEMWWDNLFMSEEEIAEVRESLRKRRESGGCSVWRAYLNEHPEAAMHDWEKEFVKKIQ
tara:strand:- start:800 stop:1021 length:222 start_codon:yes stop_codon:yes gene_type:complete